MCNIEELQNKKLLTREEAAAYIGVGKSTMQRIIHSDGFPALVRIGYKRGRVFVNRKKLDKWLDEKAGV